MVRETVTCCHCGSTDVTRYGIAPNGKQKYFCRTCQRQSRANPAPNGYPEERKEEILRAYEERSSLRGLERTFGVSRMTVIAWLKKKAAHLIHLETTLREPENPNDVTLELDELWSFVWCKDRKRWVWLALCRETRQVVAFVIGDRSAATCQRLWDAIPTIYRQGMCYSDFWEAYQSILSIIAGALGDRPTKVW